ncbi:MAG: hypothetical protein ACE5EF_06715 [Dehalococcoidia bacterium]
MIERALRLAPGWVRCWTRLYTAGLRAEIREERRNEIDSDVWEELHSPGGASHAHASMFRRSLAGIPADITWRLEHSSPRDGLRRAVQVTAGTGGAASRWLGRTGLPRLTVAVAGSVALVGLALVLTSPAGDAATRGERLAVGMLFLLTGTFMLAGTQVRSEQPQVGAAFVAVPALLLGLILWSTVLAPLVALLIVIWVVSAARRAKHSTERPPGPGGAAPKSKRETERPGD